MEFKQENTDESIGNREYNPTNSQQHPIDVDTSPTPQKTKRKVTSMISIINFCFVG